MPFDIDSVSLSHPQNCPPTSEGNDTTWTRWQNRCHAWQASLTLVLFYVLEGNRPNSNIFVQSDFEFVFIGWHVNTNHKSHSTGTWMLVCVTCKMWNVIWYLGSLQCLTPFFIIYCTYLRIMSEIDHDQFLPPVVKLSTSPYCTYIRSSQYDGTHYNDSTQYGNKYSGTSCTTLHSDSPRTCPHTVSALNDRQVDSAHFVFSMPYDVLEYNSQTSPSLVHLCNDRTTDSIHIVPYVDTLGSSQCHTRH